MIESDDIGRLRAYAKNHLGHLVSDIHKENPSEPLIPRDHLALKAPNELSTAVSCILFVDLLECLCNVSYNSSFPGIHFPTIHTRGTPMEPLFFYY